MLNLQIQGAASEREKIKEMRRSNVEDTGSRQERAKYKKIKEKREKAVKRWRKKIREVV